MNCILLLEWASLRLCIAGFIACLLVCVWKRKRPMARYRRFAP